MSLGSFRVNVKKCFNNNNNNNVKRWISHTERKSDQFMTLNCDVDWTIAKPYSAVPGPKPLPLIGNTWRLLPYIGQYQVSDLGKVSKILYDTYGKVSFIIIIIIN